MNSEGVGLCRTSLWINRTMGITSSDRALPYLSPFSPTREMAFVNDE